MDGVGLMNEPLSHMLMMVLNSSIEHVAIFGDHNQGKPYVERQSTKDQIDQSLRNKLTLFEHGHILLKINCR